MNYDEIVMLFLKYIHDNPGTIKDLVIQPNQLRKPYGLILKLMKGKYKSNGLIDDESIIRILGYQDKGLEKAYQRIIGFNEVVDPTHFNLYQNLLIDRSKKDQATELYKALNSEEITFSDFVNGLNRINKLEDVNKPEGIKQEEIDNIISSRSKILKFDRFRKLLESVGIEEKDFIIVAASAGMGKTAYALNLAYDLGKRYPVLYINIEMSRQSLVRRVVAMKTLVPLNRLKDSSRLTDEDKERIRKAKPIIENQYDVEFADGSQTIDSIERLISRFDQSKHFIVFIDHIGRISSKKQSSYERMTEIAMRLRDMSLNYNCTIFGLCQLSREAYKDGCEPSLNLLRDSGEIEQSARKVIMLWNGDESQSKDTESYKMMAYVLKNSEGRRMQIRMMFYRPTQKIEERDFRQGN